MHRILFTFTSMALFAFTLDSAAMAAASDLTPTKVVLIWQDGNRLLSSGQDSVGREIAKLFDSIGIEVEWVAGTYPKAESGSITIRVVLYGDPVYWRQSRNTMGIVFDGNGPQSSVYVFFHSIARTLGWEPKVVAGRMIDPRKRMALTRALARVVAHEVFHAVAPSLPHGPKGLTQARLDREFLLNPDAEIHPYSASVFQVELAKLSKANIDSGVAASSHYVPVSAAWKH